jgi:ankyrin repeat protein
MKRLLVLLLIPASAAFSMEKSVFPPISAEQLVPGKTEEQALLDAVHENNTKRVEQLLKQSTNPQALAGSAHEGMSALREATIDPSNQKQKEIIKLLLRYNVDVDIKESNDYMTPLMLAASQGNEDVVGWLLAAGADPNRVDKGGINTPFDWATWGVNSNKETILKMLKEAAAKRAHK